MRERETKDTRKEGLKPVEASIHGTIHEGVKLCSMAQRQTWVWEPRAGLPVCLQLFLEGRVRQPKHCLPC
jgi:hypothetical protein